jgi:RecB family exonuclease
MKLSYSSISMYLNCPYSYKLAYIDRIPVPKKPAISFGNSLHATLRDFYNVPLPVPPSLEELMKMLEKNWLSEGYKDPSEERSYFNHARTVLADFYRRETQNFKIPIALEQRFEIEINTRKNGFSLLGFIDRVDKTEEGFEVIDYKTSKKPPPLSAVHNDLQLSIYHLGVEALWGISPEKLTLYFILPGIKLSTQRSREQLEEVKELIIKTVEEIKKEKFEPRENNLCPWCDYQTYCPFFKHRFEEEVAPIKDLVEEYGNLYQKRKEINARLKEISHAIHAYCENEGVNRLFAEKYIITRYTRPSHTYSEEKLKEILSPLGLWEKVLKVDKREVDKIISRDDVDVEIKKAIEEAREVEDINYALSVKEVQGSDFF